MESEELFSEAAELEDMVKEIESDITMKQYLGKLVSNNIFKGTTMIRREKIEIFFGTLVFPILETIKNPEDLESLVRHYMKNIKYWKYTYTSQYLHSAIQFLVYITGQPHLRKINGSIGNLMSNTFVPDVDFNKKFPLISEIRFLLIRNYSNVRKRLEHI